jgi:hypothetical protein
VSVVLVYTVDCGTCGGEATSRVLDLSNPQDDGTIRIDLEMAAGQATFECDCGATVYSGDLDLETEGGDPDHDSDADEPEHAHDGDCDDCGVKSGDCCRHCQAYGTARAVAS